MLFQERFNEILLISPIQNGVNEVGVVLDSVYYAGHGHLTRSSLPMTVPPSIQ